MRIVETCDQDSSGTETAAYEILTPEGPLFLCGHHYRRNTSMSGCFSSYPAMEISASAERRYQSFMGQYGGQWR